MYLQFFDKDGDGTVTQADISRHFAISSIVCNEAKNCQQEQQQPFERLSCDVSYQNCEGMVPNEMNVGEFIVPLSRQITRPSLKINSIVIVLENLNARV